MGEHSDKEKEGHLFKYKKIIVILFVIVLGIIIYTSFFNSNLGNLNITGDFLSSNKNTTENTKIKANFTLDSLKLDGRFDEVVFTGVSENKINIEKLSPTINNSKIVLKDYKGEIILTPEKISILDGDARSIFLESSGMSFSNEKYDIKLEDFEYENMLIKDVYLRKFDKSVSGIIDIEGTYSDVNNKSVLIKKFKGEVSSRGMNNTINFEGTSEKVRIGEGGFSLSFS